MINGSSRPPVSLQTPRAVINRMKVNMSKVAELMLSSDLLMIVWGVCRETGGQDLPLIICDKARNNFITLCTHHPIVSGPLFAPRALCLWHVPPPIFIRRTSVSLYLLF